MGIYIALGANQPARYNGQVYAPAQTFKHVLGLLSKDMQILAVSNLWQSPAWPDPDAGPSYINGVCEVETMHESARLLEILKQTEATFGRTKTLRNAPRPLDLDILDYNEQILDSDVLTLPHPRMLSRPFVLLPLAEVAPNWRDPKKKRTIQDWTARLSLNEVAPLQRLGPLL
ncbi:MAG: 2-amino-4-hydroxy-6-hydroxymethyldihydropteridine diphosphokinase [Robiginitomaculum sp.]|nr:2-amino-4-hydroxy-6-hydroxymethyldihydropteridine diphosphokinase [Robiginitomaculum sp.]